MKWLKAIFATPETAGKVVDGVYNGLDKAFYTEEERAETENGLREFFLKYLEATNPQNLARRVLAFLVAGIWSALIIAATVLSIAAALLESATAAMAAKAVVTILTDHVNVPFAGIMAFYFLTHLARGYRKG